MIITKSPGAVIMLWAYSGYIHTFRSVSLPPSVPQLTQV